MNKKELINAIAKKEGITKKEAETMVDAVFYTIAQNLISGEKVLITGFGTFNVHYRKERKGISPKTREEMIIPASRSLTFKPCTSLKESLNIDS